MILKTVFPASFVLFKKTRWWFI